jgi:hypothetical protein
VWGLYVLSMSAARVHDDGTDDDTDDEHVPARTGVTA